MRHMTQLGLRSGSLVIGLAIGMVAADVAPAFAKIEQITVTVRKREESLQDVPVAATAFSTADLERYTTDALDKLAILTPSLHINASGNGGGGSIYLRGIGTPPNSAGFEQAVSLNLDGIGVSRGRAVQQAYFDMANVEVLKGPQALYFGKNSPGGIIAIRSNNPTDEFEAIARLGYEFTEDRVYGEGIVSGPLSEKVGARLAVRATSSRGFLINDAQPRSGVDPRGFDLPGATQRRGGGKDEFLGRVTFTFEPTDNFDANLKISGVDFSGDGENLFTTLTSCPFGTAQPIFGVSDPDGDCTLNRHISQGSAPSEISVDWPNNDRNGEIYSKYHSIMSVLTLTQRFENLTLTSVTGFYHYKTRYFGNYDFSGAAQIFAAESSRYSSISEEFRVNTTFDGAFNFLAGVYYQNADLRFTNASRIAAVPADSRNGRYYSWWRPTRTDGETWSAFGELTVNVTDQIELAGGVRWTREVKDSLMYHEYVHELLAALFVAEGVAITDHFVDEDVSPQVTLTWRPEDNMTFFAAYRSGYKSGGFSNGFSLRAGSKGSDAAFESESAEGGEIGAKLDLMDSSLRLNMTAYRYTYKNLQVNVYNAEAASFRVQNAASARTTGFEAELQYSPPNIDGLLFHAAYNYNKGVYTDFLGQCYAGQTLSQGCTEAPGSNGIPTSQDLAGRSLLFAPRHNGNVGFSYDWALGNLFRATLTTDLRYTTKYETVPTYRPEGIQKGYVSIDASLILYDDDSGWQFKIIGRNLTNKITAIYGGDRPLTGSGTGTANGVLSDQFNSIGRPREVGIELTFRFN